MSQEIGVNEMVRLTGFVRETVAARLEKIPFKPGPNRSKLYDSEAALRALFLGEGEASPQDQLALIRKEEIKLNMEVTRKQRIPLDDVEEGQDRALQNCGGILKAHEGKTLSPELIQEIFAEFRNMGEALKKS